MIEPRVDEDSAKLALMELAEAFGVEEGDVQTLLSLAMAGRVYIKDGKAVYEFRQPVPKGDGDLSTVSLRSPSASDFLTYTKGVIVTVSADKKTEIDMAMMGRRTLRAVSTLSGEALGVVERMSRRDLDDLTAIGDALGFFD